MSIFKSLHKVARIAIFSLILLIIPVSVQAQEICPIANYVPDKEFTNSFMIDKCKFTLKDVNPFFPIRPGWQVVLESEPSNGEPGEVSVVTVLDEIREVDGIKTRVIEELAFEKNGDELIPLERSLNFFAICKQTGSVFYFGEDSSELDENGNVIATTGSWLAGTNGARAGIIMPGTILVGGGYYEEIAPADSALDKARIKEIHENCEAGGIHFDEQCIETFNTSDCDLDAAEKKIYAKNIGNIVDEELEVKSFGFAKGKGHHRHRHNKHNSD
jgi:hypothetical protein